MLITTSLHAIETCESLLKAADQLTKASYTSVKMQQNALAFVQNNDHDDINAVQQLPSVTEIITKVSQLQDSNGLIEDLITRKLALRALNDAIKATDHAILQASNAELIDVLNNQKIALQDKIYQLKRKSLWLFLSKPSTRPLLIATAVIIIATGTTHYYYKFNEVIEEDFSATTPNLTSKDFEKPVYIKLKQAMSNFFNENNRHKQDLLEYVQIAKDLIPQLDPIKDANCIDLLNILITAPDKKNIGGFFNGNRDYWISIYKRRHHYNNIAAHYMNVDPKSIELDMTFFHKVDWQR